MGSPFPVANKEYRRLKNLKQGEQALITYNQDKIIITKTMIRH